MWLVVYTIVETYARYIPKASLNIHKYTISMLLDSKKSPDERTLFK